MGYNYFNEVEGQQSIGATLPSLCLMAAVAIGNYYEESRDFEHPKKLHHYIIDRVATEKYLLIIMAYAYVKAGFLLKDTTCGSWDWNYQITDCKTTRATNTTCISSIYNVCFYYLKSYFLHNKQM